MIGGLPVFGIMFATFAILPWLVPKHRPLAVLIPSVLVGALLQHWFLAISLGFTWFAVRGARFAWSTPSKLALLLGVWLAVVVPGWIVLPYVGDSFSALAAYWGCLPPAIIWLVLDNDGRRLEGVSELEQWLYLLAFPRFATPFIHPIGAARFVRSRQSRQSLGLSLRALGLALYTMLVFYILQTTHFSAKSSSDTLSLVEHGPRIVRNALHIYAYNAGNIFLAVSLLRLAGYDLGSGFRWPVLSASPSEFFRRWNYYFFDFANVAIFMPIVSRLRRWLPLWLVYVIGAYASFALGVWVLDNMSRLPASRFGISAFKALSNPYDLRVHFAMWSMVIAAQLVIMPARRLRRYWWWRVAGHVGTWALAIAGLVWLFVSKNRLY